MTRLHSSRVFIVEDEPIIAIALEDLLEDMGHVIVACATNIDEGCRLAQTVECDFAILDINLNGQRSDPIAIILRGRRIPYFFATGYGVAGRGGEENAHVIEKPYDRARVEEAIRLMIQAG